MYSVYPSTFTDSSIIFKSFKFFMVKLYFSVFSVTSVVKNRILIYGGRV